MTRYRPQTLVFVLLLVIVIVVLAACSIGGDSSTCDALVDRQVENNVRWEQTNDGPYEPCSYSDLVDEDQVIRALRESNGC